MSDNIVAPGTGAVLAFDDVVIGGSSVLVSRVKLGFGADGTYTGDVSTTNRFPVDVGTSVAITAATLPLPTSAATSALQTTGNTSLASIDGKTPALVSGSVPVVDSALVTLMTANNTKLDTLNTSINTSGPLPAGTNSIGTVVLGAGSAAVGTVGVTGSVAVTGTFFQATQPVSLAALPALPTGTNSIGSVTVTGSVAVTGPLTDTQLRASAVPVSTTNATVTLTDRNGTITTGGTAQTLSAANASRKGFKVQNNSAGDLRFTSKGTASSTNGILLPGGKNALYEYVANGVPGGALSIWGATTGQAFEASEW